MGQLLCTFAYASDIAFGLQLEDSVRSCYLAFRLAQRLGLSEDDCRAAYYAALLKDAGCTSWTTELASAWHTDEIVARRELLILGNPKERMRRGHVPALGQELIDERDVSGNDRESGQQSGLDCLNALQHQPPMPDAREQLLARFDVEGVADLSRQDDLALLADGKVCVQLVRSHIRLSMAQACLTGTTRVRPACGCADGRWDEAEGRIGLGLLPLLRERDHSVRYKLTARYSK